MLGPRAVHHPQDLHLGDLMTDVPLVSVVIPTYNYGHFLASAVRSALEQTWVAREVIVVDDGSTDNTPEVLRAFGRDVRVIRKVNAGLSAARNTGIEAATGAFIAILDADDVWMAHKLERQLAVFRDLPDTGIVSCAAHQVDADGNRLQLLPCPSTAEPHRLRRELAFRNVVSGGSAALVRRECFELVGRFDESLRSSEDWDMWLRIARHFPIRFVNEPLVSIRVTGDNMSGVRHADRMLANELRVIDKQVAEDPCFARDAGGPDAVRSYRLFCAAWAHWQGQERAEALRHLGRAFRLHPASFLRRPQAGLLFRVLLGRSRSP